MAAVQGGFLGLLPVKWVLDRHEQHCVWCFVVDTAIALAVTVVWYRIEGWPHRLDCVWAWL